jgi:hypothetical protein
MCWSYCSQLGFPFPFFYFLLSNLQPFCSITDDGIRDEEEWPMQETKKSFVSQVPSPRRSRLLPWAVDLLLRFSGFVFCKFHASHQLVFLGLFFSYE